MVIAIGCDHAGFPYKAAITQMLEDEGHHILDLGTDSTDSVDYPDFIHPVAEALEQEVATYGILICGSGNGVAMTANKHQGVRAGVCWQKELAILARAHNNANALAIAARIIALPLALDLVKAFMETDFEGGRHDRRVGKISKIC